MCVCVQVSVHLNLPELLLSIIESYAKKKWNLGLTLDQKQTKKSSFSSENWHNSLISVAVSTSTSTHDSFLFISDSFHHSFAREKR